MSTNLPPPYTPQTQPYASPQIQRDTSSNPANSTNTPPANPGLDQKIIECFPAFLYSAVKNYRLEKYGLECAICLAEFADDDKLRLLTTCYHVFHQECVDLWLSSHKTCPVCRRELETSQDNAENNNASLRDEFIINIIRENNETNGDDHEHHEGVHGQPISQNIERSRKEQVLPEKFSRSHSTGHSIIRNKPEEEDRYTLRLPDHVKIKITRGHNQTESCITFGELTIHKACKSGRFGELSGQKS